MNLRTWALAALALPALVAASCSRQPSRAQAVYFGPTPVYRLAPGTREVAPEAVATKEYERMFNFHPNYNQPLHRIVKGGPQTVYLGLVLQPAPANLAELTQTDSIWTRLDGRSLPKGAVLAFLKSRKDGYNVRYLGLSEKSKEVHLINLVTEDSALARSYYDADTLFKGNLLL